MKERKRLEGQKGEPRMAKKKNKKVTDETLSQDPMIHTLKPLMEEVNRYEAKVNRYIEKAMEAFGPYKIASKKLIELLRAKQTDPDRIAYYNELLNKLDLIGIQPIAFSKLLAGGSGSA